MTTGTVGINFSARSLSGSETIQPGDIHWTNRDHQYRLCNFTLGMRASDAMQRGLDHGEKWVFYRAMKASKVQQLAEINAPILKGESGSPKPSKDQPPRGYRMLGDAKDEPRIEGDQYWSLAIKGWTVLTSHKVEYANRDDWAACRKIEKPPKRYREPTLADLANGPIECEVRDVDTQDWVRAILHAISDAHCFGRYRYWAHKLTVNAGLYYAQCRIEVQE